MDKRFTDRARKVMQLADQEARRLNHEYIGTEHVLLALIEEGNSVATTALQDLDADLRRIRLEVEKLVQSGAAPVAIDKLPQTPRCQKAIEFAIEESGNLRHNYIGAEHILLGLLREQEGIAAKVLNRLGLEADAVREAILELLGYGLEENLDRPDTSHLSQTAAKGFLQKLGGLFRTLTRRK
jgi:ATP-dependent Clp protease ATP-binding subunit ClpC